MKFFFSFLLLLSFFGCSKDAQPKSDKELQFYEGIRKNAPPWINENNSTLEGVGAAYKTTGGVKFQQTEAMANGKDRLRLSLERKLSAIIGAVFKTIYKKKKSNYDKVKLEKVSKKIATHISLRSVSKSKKKSVWFDDKENLYILVTIDPKIVQKLSISSMETLLRGDKIFLKNYRDNNGRKIFNYYFNKEIKESLKDPVK